MSKVQEAQNFYFGAAFQYLATLQCCTSPITSALSVRCVAGCCLIPFHMKSLRNVHHQCPRCQEHIHTYNPL
uniref:LITAF domain-containing protein n=1 Tax=Amphiprion ocellaris TaxID=80972 RepID=A0AAQ5X343_AMPOC